MLDEKDIRQVDLLVDFCKKNRKLPFYIIYTLLDSSSLLMCGGFSNDFWREKSCSIIIDAITIKDLGDKCLSKKKGLHKNDILNKGNPFCCLFCCPYALQNGNIKYLREYLRAYYSNLDEFSESVFQEIPQYVLSILYNEFDEYFIEEYNLFSYKKIGVLDISND